jgi:hypothetical protein
MTDLFGQEPRKFCRICKSEKPLSDFYRLKGGRDGHRNDCKACNLAARAAKYRENPRPAIERALRWQRENAERHQVRQREYAESGKKKVSDRKSHLKRKYGLSLEQYDAMLAAQGGVCAICHQPRPEERTLHVDHDHATGAIRGLLCFTCNNALGDFRDSAELFHAAADYLDRDADMTSLAQERAAALVSA